MVSHTAHLFQLADTLETLVKDGTRVATWTKRLDYVMWDHTPFESADRHLGALSRLIQSLPNLEIIHFRSSSRHISQSFPSSLVKAMCQTFGPSLRVAIWSEQNLVPVLSDIIEHIMPLPKLEILIHPSVRHWQAKVTAAPDVFHFSTIGMVHDVNLPVLPSVTTLIAGFLRREQCLSLSVSFPNLTKLILTCPNSHLETLTDRCSSLRSIVYTVDHWGDLLEFHPPPVEYIGLKSPSLQFQSYANLFKGLVRLGEDGSLKRVQLLSPITVRDLRVRHTRELTRGIEKLKSASRTFALLDDLGDPLL